MSSVGERFSEALRAMTSERDALAAELAVEKDYALSGWTLANKHLARVKTLETKVAKARELLEKCGYRGWAKAKNAWLDDAAGLAQETPAKSPPSFSGWISGACENCGKLAGNHIGLSMACYEADRGGKP